MAVSQSLTLTEKTVDTSGNKSTVRILWTSTQSGESHNDYTKTAYYYVSINGGAETTYSVSYTLPSNTTKTIADTTITVPHRTDGTGSISVRTYMDTGISAGVVRKNASKTLTVIARESTIAATNANIGSTSAIVIDKKSSGYTSTVTYNFSGLTGTIATKTSSTSIAFTVPDNFYTKIPSAKKGTCTLCCTTYNGNTQIGSTKSCTFTVYAVEENCNPTLSPNIYDSNSVTTALTGNSGVMVKYFSNATFSTGAAARKSATLSSQKVVCGNKSATTASGVLNGVESGAFVVSATDSRGYTKSQNVTKSLVDYVKLTCNMLAQAPDTDGNTQFGINGDYFNGSFGLQNNTLAVYYRYKADGGEYGDWTPTTATLNGNTYTATVSLSGLDYRVKYTFQAKATDKLYTGGVLTAEQSVRTIPIFDWGENDFNFNVPASAPSFATAGNITVGGGMKGAHANESVTDVLAFALACPAGVTPFATNSGSTNIPDAQYLYSTGWVHKRSSDQIDVYLKNYKSGTLAINTYLSGAWTGWEIFHRTEQGSVKFTIPESAKNKASVVSVNVTFSNPFNETPIVVISPTTSDPASIDVSVNNVTTTGFAAQMRATYAGARWVYYVAVG